MKRALIILVTVFQAVIILFVSCTVNGQPVKTKKTSKLVVLLYDITRSDGNYAIMNEMNLVSLFNSICHSGGGDFYGYLIKSNSNEQDPVHYKVPAFDTLQLSGNRYQINNQRMMNKKIIEAKQKELSVFISSVSSRLLVRKNEPYTDIYHAMNLALTNLSQEKYSSYLKTLVIVSDLIQDLPGVKEPEFESSYKVPDGVRILVVRPSPGIDLKKVFPSGKVEKYVSIEDAFLTL
jgi:hypothetical protein